MTKINVINRNGTIIQVIDRVIRDGECKFNRKKYTVKTCPSAPDHVYIGAPELSKISRKYIKIEETVI